MIILSYLVLKDFFTYDPHRCKNLASNHMKMNLMGITPLHPMLISLASVCYSFGKKNSYFLFLLCVFVDIPINCFFFTIHVIIKESLAQLLAPDLIFKEQALLVSIKSS